MQLVDPQRSVAPGTAEDLSILLFRVGGHSFAVPLDHVRYVAPMAADFVASGDAAEKYFVFEGEPLDYLSLWDALGLQSEYREYEDMQSMLPQRLRDHTEWMNALESAIHNGTSFAKARDAHECAFGKWYYAYQATDRRLALLLGQFEQPHVTIHSLADRLLGMAEQGLKEEALHIFEEHKQTTLATLLRLFDAAGKLVVELQRRIAIVAEAEGVACALGADYVLDIVNVPAARRKPAAARQAGGRVLPVSSLVVLEDQRVVPLLDWRRLLGAAAAA